MVRFASSLSTAVVESVRPVKPRRRGPWASLVNQVAVVDGIEITLLSYVVADDAIRVHGALRVTGNHEPRLASVPVLDLTQVGDMCPMRPLGARVLPLPPIVWLAWMFELPGPGPRVIAARIEQLQFGYRTGKNADVVVGPWLFEDITGPDDGHEPALRLVAVEA